MTLTIEQLRKELHRELTPMRDDIRELRTDVTDVRVKVAALPTRDEIKEMVTDKTEAIKGNLLGWIVGTALLVIGSLSGVVFGIAKLLE